MRSLLTVTLASILLSGCAAQADLVPNDPQERLRSQTVLYIELIASGDRFEVESSELALQRTQNPSVRDFASRMIDAHTRMSDDLAVASRTVRPAAPAFALVSHHFDMLEQLRHAGPEFDSLYRDFQVTVHQEAIQSDQDYAATGNVAALAALARHELGMVETHLQQAQQLPVPPTPVVAPSAPTPPPPPSTRAGERG